ncbi:hypothetical protein OS31_43580 [Dickeya oryzae]
MSIFTDLNTSRKWQIDQWLSAINSHIEKIQQCAHSAVNPTPLLADGFEIKTQSPVVWRFPDGHDAPISNFASQQNWLRLLISMSAVTETEKYRQSAFAQCDYFLNRFVDENSGLFLLGRASFYSSRHISQ